MIFLEAYQIAILMALFVNAALSDLHRGIVSNKSILFALAAGIVSVIPYYAFFATDCLTAYAINLVIGIGVSLLLYAMGIWGAGDSKLLSVTVIVFPARLYCINNRSLASCFLLISIVFIIAFIYVIVDTLVLGIKQKDLFKLPRRKFDWKGYLKGFLFFFLLLALFNGVLFAIMPDTLLIDGTLLAAIHFVVILIGLRLEEKANWYIVLAMGVAYVAMLLCGIVQFDLSSINWGMYVVVILLVLFRSFADKYNYKTISVSELKPGMILSMGSILLFAKSRVKGLPTFSTEDLKSRLSAEEVDSINRWSKTSSGQEAIVIVRKIPFALFIGVGTLLFAVWEVLVG